MYNQAGQLLFEQSRGYDGSLNASTEYIYLGTHNIAERKVTNGGNGGGIVLFKHTDMLGSVVLNTNSAGVAQEINHYQPYGAPNTHYPSSGIGYAGHKMDNATGLSYMQQRYYSPHKGIFLSVDPVGVDTGGGGNFNRYWYANNNPYKYVDPDGRYTCEGSKADCKKVREALKKVRDYGKGSVGLKARSARLAAKAVGQLYGKEGDKNGVVVDTVNNPKGGAAGSASGNYQDAEQNSGNSVQITIKLDMSQSGDANMFSGTLFHEGVHGIDIMGIMLGDDWESQRKRTWLTETETRAYSLMAEYYLENGWTVPWLHTDGIVDPKKVQESVKRSVDKACQSGWCW